MVYYKVRNPDITYKDNHTPGIDLNIIPFFIAGNRYLPDKVHYFCESKD